MKTIRVYHILLIIILCFLIYLDYQYFLDVDISKFDLNTTPNSNKIARKAASFVFLHCVIGIVSILSIVMFTEIFEQIIKFLNRPIKFK